MKPIKCLIVDDEELARTLLENYTRRLPFLEITGTAKNPLEAMSVLNSREVDLIFLDIQMPELTGIEFLKTMNKKPLVVFTTAYPEYALEGYALDVVDYLLKPFGFERFVQAVNKAAERLKPKAGDDPPPTAETGAAQPKKTHLTLKSEHKLHRIPLEDILYIQSMREYIAVYTPAGRILSLGSLKNLEEELPAGQFIRIHKSYMVALDKASTLEGNMLYVGKEKLPVGSSYKEALVSALF